MSRNHSDSNQIKLTIITPTFQLLDMIYWNVHRSRVRYAPDFKVETIIIDGGSDPYIAERLKNLENSEIPDVKVITVPGNKHDSYNMNAACKIARGEYVVKIDSDVLVRNKVFWTDLMTALEDNPDDLIGTSLTSTWTRGNGNLLGGWCLAWKRDSQLVWDESYFGYGPSDMDWNVQFLNRGSKLIKITDRGIQHLGGILDGLFYVKSREQMRKENKVNHDIYMAKWENKLPVMKGFL